MWIWILIIVLVVIMGIVVYYLASGDMGLIGGKLDIPQPPALPSG